MKFQAVPISQAEGLILGHNITHPDGRRALRKGKPITAADVDLLHRLGRQTVYVACIEAGDVAENTAAARIARAMAGDHVRLSGGATGRVNLYAETLGIVRVDEAVLTAVNRIPGVTLATLRRDTAVVADKMVATLKIIPYALPEASVAQAEACGAQGAAVAVVPIPARRVSLILSGSPASETRVRAGFSRALAARLTPLGATLEAVAFVPLEDEQGELSLAAMIAGRITAGTEMVILAGETAIMDRYDIAPRAVERAGGVVTCFGAPVDPGNLLMLGYHGRTPVLGAPGCVRSPKTNIIDLILPRLLAGDRLEQADIIALAHGGLLDDVPERGLPRGTIG